MTYPTTNQKPVSNLLRRDLATPETSNASFDGIWEGVPTWWKPYIVLPYMAMSKTDPLLRDIRLFCVWS